MQLVITASPEALGAIIYNDHQVTLTPDLWFHIRRFHKHREHILDNMKRAGFTGCNDDTRITKANMLYFPCEAVETRIMAGALRRMLHSEKASSLIWLHDGMYAHQEIPTEHTIRAIRESAEEIGIRNLQIKITNCTEAYKALPECSPDPASKALVDEVNDALDTRHQNSSAAGGKPVDLDKPLGKIKGAIHKKRYCK